VWKPAALKNYGQGPPFLDLSRPKDNRGNLIFARIERRVSHYLCGS